MWPAPGVRNIPPIILLFSLLREHSVVLFNVSGV